MRYISTSDAQTLLLCDGILGDVFRRRVRSLELCFQEGNVAYYYHDITFCLTESHLHIRTVLERTGHNIERLQYDGDDLVQPPPHMAAWIEPFATHCKNVRHLTLFATHSQIFQRILAAQSGMLESL